MFLGFLLLLSIFISIIVVSVKKIIKKRRAKKEGSQKKFGNAESAMKSTMKRRQMTGLAVTVGHTGFTLSAPI